MISALGRTSWPRAKMQGVLFMPCVPSKLLCALRQSDQTADKPTKPMSETIELVQEARASGKTVKEACKEAGISVPHYYAIKKRKLNGSRMRRARHEETPHPQATNGQYLAILDALRFIHHGDFVSAQAILVEALKV